MFCFTQVTRILGAFSYWENDIMRINQAVVLFKFLPLVATVVNSATAFIFISACQPFLPPDSYYVLVNCSRTFVISGNTYEIKCKFRRHPSLVVRRF